MKTRGKTSAARPKHTGLWLLLMALLIAELMAATWCRLQCVRLGYEISAQTEETQRLTALQDTLRIELARLKSPQRISEIARARFGLTPPTPEQVVVLP